MSKERRFVLSYPEAHKEILKRALIERKYNLELAEVRTNKGAWNKEIEALNGMIEQIQ